MAAYARQAVARTSGGWTVAGLVVSNAGAIAFPQSATGPESETYAGIGSAASGAGRLFLRGALGATLVVNNLVTPNFAIGVLTFTLSGAFATTEGTNHLKMLFQAVAWANVADNAAGSPLTNLYVSLHTADPGVGGSQTTSEAAYT